MEIKLKFNNKKEALRTLAQIEKSSKADAAASRKEPDNLQKIVILRCHIPLSTNCLEDLADLSNELILFQEPNKNDRWTTKVSTKHGTPLGYLPPQKAQSVARLIDAGKTITALLDDSAIPTSNPNQNTPSLPIVLYMDVKLHKEKSL